MSFKNIIIILVISVFCLSAKAQKRGYQQGYIIAMNGDTIKGMVKDRSPGTFVSIYDRIRFKSEDSFLRKKYSPNQIQGYGVGGRHYLSIPLREETAFFKFRYYVDPGANREFLRVVTQSQKLIYFEREWIDDDNNHVDSAPLFQKAGSSELVLVTNGIFGLKKKRLAEYFSDCPDLVKAIENKELKEIMEVYNFYLKKC